jgi:hypothetical protein
MNVRMDKWIGIGTGSGEVDNSPRARCTCSLGLITHAIYEVGERYRRSM